MAERAELEAILKLKDEFSSKISTIERSIGKLDKSTKGAKGGISGMTKGIGDLVTRTTGLSPLMFTGAGAVAALGAAMVATVGKTVQFGSQLADLSSKTGLNTTELQELKFAGEQAGVGFQQVTDAVVRLGRRTAAELPEATKSLDKLGLTVDDILSQSPGEGFALIADKIAAIDSPAQQAAIAMGVFGDAGLQVLPAINQGVSDNIDRFRELGATMSGESVDAAKKFSDSLTDLKTQWDGIVVTIGSAVIPALSNLLTFFGDLLPGAIQLGTSIFLAAIADQIGALADAAAAAAVFSDKFVGVADSLFQAEINLNKMSDSAKASSEANFLAATGADTMSASLGSGGTGGGLAGSATVAAVALEEVANKGNEMAGDFTATVTPAVVELAEEFGEVANQAGTMAGDFDGTIVPGMTTGAQEIVASTEGMEVSFGDVRGILGDLGIEADGTFGKMLGWADQLIGAFGSGGLGGILDGIGGKLGGIGDFLGGGGGGIGGLLGGGLGGIAGLAIGGIGAGIGAIANIGERDEGTVQEEFLRDLGVSVSEDFAQAVHDSGLNPQAFVDELAQSDVLNGAALATEIAEVSSVLEQGGIDSLTAAETIKNALPELIKDIEAGIVDPQNEAVKSALQVATDMGLDVSELVAAINGGGPATTVPSAPGTPGTSTTGTGAGGAVTINLDVPVTVQAGVVTADPAELAAATAEATRLSIADNLGGIQGAIERALDGVFERT